MPLSMLPVDDHVPLAGSYNSAVVGSDSAPLPPTTSTRPSRSRSCFVSRPRRAHRPGWDPGASRTRGEGSELQMVSADTLGLGDVASGDAVAIATTDGSGTGGTTDGSRSRPEPAANAPPTSNRAAAAKSVMPGRRPDRRAVPLASRRRSRASTVRSSAALPDALSGPRGGDLRGRRRRAHACRTSATGIGSSASAVRRCASADFSWVLMVFGLTSSTSATVSTGRSR